MLNDLKNRGVQDVLFFCVDGLPGFKEAIGVRRMAIALVGGLHVAFLVLFIAQGCVQLCFHELLQDVGLHPLQGQGGREDPEPCGLCGAGRHDGRVQGDPQHVVHIFE